MSAQYRLLTIRLEPDRHRALKTIAAREGRSMQRVAEQLLVQFIAKYEESRQN